MCLFHYPGNVSSVWGRRVLWLAMAEGTWTRTSACERTLKLTAIEKGCLFLSLPLYRLLPPSHRHSIPFLTLSVQSRRWWAGLPPRVPVRTEIPARIVLLRRGVTPSPRWMSLIRVPVSAIYVVAQLLLVRPAFVEGQWWSPSGLSLISNLSDGTHLLKHERIKVTRVIQ